MTHQNLVCMTEKVKFEVSSKKISVILVVFFIHGFQGFSEITTNHQLSKNQDNFNGEF